MTQYLYQVFCGNSTALNPDTNQLSVLNIWKFFKNPVRISNVKKYFRNNKLIFLVQLNNHHLIPSSCTSERWYCSRWSSRNCANFSQCECKLRISSWWIVSNEIFFTKTYLPSMVHLRIWPFLSLIRKLTEDGMNPNSPGQSSAIFITVKNKEERSSHLLEYRSNCSVQLIEIYFKT